MKKYLLEALSQPSGWSGIVGGLTLLGIAISPEQSQLIQIAGAAVISAIMAFVKW